MCRNIRVLHHFEPPSTMEEMQAAALQYVRKVSGLRAPNASDQAAFDKAIAEITESTRRLLNSLHQPKTPFRTREGEREKGKLRWQQRAARMSAR